MVHPRPLALTLDLDDTLWPIWPVIERAEQALHEWLARHSPTVAERWPIPAMRSLRQRVLDEHPDIGHDPAALRLRTLTLALIEAGADPALARPAYAVFHAVRNRVEPYPDVPQALERLARTRRLAVLTNGTADVALIGLGDYFAFSLSAVEHGAAKPSACIFHAACRRLDVEPAQVLHVGDDPDADVRGAREAGLTTCWINRDGRPWPYPDTPPTVECRDLWALADWLADAEPLSHS